MEMALVDPGHQRHQFDGIDTKPLEMGQCCRICQRRYSTTLFWCDVRVAYAEGLDRHFINPAWGMRGWAYNFDGGRCDDCLGHQVFGFAGVLAQAGMEGVGTVKLGGVWVDEQFVHVETHAVVGVPRAFGAQAVVGTSLDPGDETKMHVAVTLGQFDAMQLALAMGIEVAKENACGMDRGHSHIDATRDKADAEGRRRATGLQTNRCQVITVGSVRPVWPAMSGIERDRAIRSASAVCVSVPCCAGSAI